MATSSSYVWVCTRTNDGVQEGLEWNMKKWIERLITAAGIAILVGIFCYQVAYGHSSVNAC
jgi:hypothetical protein